MRKILALLLRTFAKLILWKYKPYTVGITGSVGKSTTKEAVYTVLKPFFSGEIRKNEENFNTEIGLPLTIIGGHDAKRSIAGWAKNFFRASILILFRRKYPKALILEMAADRPGDIKYLASMVPLDIAVVTAIGKTPVHLEFFESRSAYVAEKASILSALKPNGTAVLNADDPTVRAMEKNVPQGAKTMLFGFEEASDVQGFGPFYLTSTRTQLERVGMSFKIGYQGSTVPVRLHSSIGVGIMYAALCACAVGIASQMNLVSVAGALENFVPLKQRMTILKGIKGTILIDDTYNASPLSVEAALDALSQFGDSRKIAVLGDMRELGIETESAHREIAKKAHGKAEIIFLVGPAMAYAKEELEKSGRTMGENLFWARNAESISGELQTQLMEGDVVLIKGSRAVMMDELVEEIREI